MTRLNDAADNSEIQMLDSQPEDSSENSKE